MLWLEMSRDRVHGGGAWGFTKCLWSPSRKSDGTKWSYWDTVLRTQAGDSVLHLRGQGKDAAFVGFSTINVNGVETIERPPEPGRWSYASSFYRALLTDFVPFTTPALLTTLFRTQDVSLRDYFYFNKARDNNLKRRLFYVIQAGRLQCLNGAYLSEVDEELLNIIFGGSHLYLSQTSINQTVIEEVSTGEQIQQLRSRIGQNNFSEQVRNNYNHRCCFPACEVNERQFLGAHIARWADAPELRGKLDNGLCLCLMHDKAFELGLFTITTDLCIWINHASVTNSSWGMRYLLPYHGKQILCGKVLPSRDVLLHHWHRTGLYPSSECN